MITIKVGNHTYKVTSGSTLAEAKTICSSDATVFAMYCQGVRAKARNLIERRWKAGASPDAIQRELDTWHAGTKSGQSIQQVQNVKDSYKNMDVDELSEVAGDLARTIRRKK